MIQDKCIDHGESSVSEEQGQLSEAQSNASENPLDLAVRTPLPNNRPIASNRDEDFEDFVGYMD
ncbi:hypothetical protein C1752_00414 [Acaryochloris thomasi RCC1774]|uniref:Uncharacterized protein n=1 Tax=Acaryochloris thomasi RCC1774 TaxID=1764569 RepID=A0A2W1JQJ5_9CYAN|nr:hypothetical protein [Acaryochloris thomasi]PZD75529.1 hypothetical protein C1752_00414 [Acaryochloris thomasi RCC1774]